MSENKSLGGICLISAFKKFINSNVLLVDEDINSGASLRLAAEALQMKMPKEWNHSHLLGLVNASAKTGY